MDRTRASSLESHPNITNKYDSVNINSNNVGRRNRLHSLVGNQPEFSDDSCSMDYYYKRNRSLVTNSDLKSQFDVLQCTVNRMLNGGVFDDMGTAVPSVNLSEALKHEYRQMMSALKELESILGCKRKNSEINFPPTSCNTDSDIHQMQREIYFRDSLIKCLSDRLKVLCKANDKLIIDYENQENILSEELICLKRQLEKAKDALRSLSALKSRSNISMVQDIESETYYLRESLRTKEMMVSDLKHRLDKVICENSDLKCELENNSPVNSRYGSNQLDRELSYSNRKNDQLLAENESLKAKLECKIQIINDLQMKMNCGVMSLQDHSMINQLREELLIANEENEMTKEAILEQSDLLEDYKSQIKILSENNIFKDETISELRCCLRKLTECSPSNVPIRDTSRNKNTDERGSQSLESKTHNLNSLLTSIKRYINQNQPNLIQMFDNELDPYNSLEKFMINLIGMTNQTNNNPNDIELFKEFLTNEINLKNSILKYLTTNFNGELDGLERLQAQMNSILSFDMDRGFKSDLKNYLHQCFLLDDNLRSVVEFLVKSFNNLTSKNRLLSSENLTLIERNAMYAPNKLRDKQSLDTNSRMTNTTTNTHESSLPLLDNSQVRKIEQLEEELKVLNNHCQQDRRNFNSELESKNQQLNDLNHRLADLQKRLDGKSSIDGDYRKLNVDYEQLLNKSKQCQQDNDQLKDKLEDIGMKNQQLERSLNLKNTELENLEASLRRMTDQFANLSSTQEASRKSIENKKDAEIDKLNKEISNLKNALNNSLDLKQSNVEYTKKISTLSKNVESLEAEVQEMNKMIKNLQKELDECNMEKLDLLDSLRQLQEEKNREIEELLSKVNREPKLKSIQTDHNDDLLESMEKLKRENLQSIQLRTSVSSLKVENKTMEIRFQSLLADKAALESQVKQLKSKFSELNRNCEENHVSKHALKSENDQSELCKKKVVDLESVLVCLTDELNEKVQLLENLRKAVKSDSGSLQNIDVCADLNDMVEINKQLLLQKESEIAFLKSKINAIEVDKCSEVLSQKRLSADCYSPRGSQIQNLLANISDLERQLDNLNHQLTERSANITHLQKLLNEKDEIIENSHKIIKAKSQSIGESEKMMHLLSLENTNIKDELSSKFQDESQIKLLKSTINNLTDEIANLRLENDQCRMEVNKLNAEREQNASIKSKSQLSHYSPQKSIVQSPLASSLPDSSVQQINNEIQKLYIDFEGKSNEIKEYSLKEIKNRDRKIDELNLELKLKSDQFQTIVVENRRLQDRIEDDSQKSSRYEQNLLLKEQLLDKLLKEKEKIRATFITELHNKNEELTEKSKTVYFLNAELHRLASEVEILSSELHVVKLSEKYGVQSQNVLEISQVNLDSLKTENNSLKLCVNLKMAELESLKNELTIKQISNKTLTDEVQNIKTNSVKSESDLQKTIDSLTQQLKEIQEDYRNIVQSKSILESAVKDLEKDNLSLKQVKEKLDNEKLDYQTEINELQSKIESLTNSLIDSKNRMSRKSIKFENEQDEVRRLADILETNRKSIANKEETLRQAMQQIDELSEENSKYKQELDNLSKRFHELEGEYRSLSAKLDKSNEEIRSKEQELAQYRERESQLNNGFKRKSVDCDQLKNDYDELLKQFQQKIDEFEIQDKQSFRMIEQKTSQCSYIQESLEHAKNQLFMADDKLKTCNSQWLDKYGQLKSNFEQMEYDFQNQLDTITQDRDALETTMKNQSCKLSSLNESYHKLNEENAQLMRENCMKSTEIDRICCEKNALQNCNLKLTSQIESITGELLAAHTEICELTVQLHDSQSKINEFSFKLKENLSSIRHYGSHPLLNQADLCGSDHMNFEQKDYCDLRTRYSALCNQIDNLICQLKKKDKHIMDMQNEHDQMCRKLLNYEQIQCDYQDLDYKYQQLKEDFNNLSQYYQNINYSHKQRDHQMQDHEVSVIQVCADELQDTITCQNHQIDDLRSSNQALISDYQMVCDRLNQLEKQIQIDNMELEKRHQDYCSSENNYKQLENKYDQLKYNYDEFGIQIEQINELKQELTDKTTRIMEITNINENIEQQLNCQNQLIGDLKMKISNMESFYEQELEMCRHNLSMMKTNGKPYAANELHEKINCLKEKNQSLECELLDLQNQYRIQCLNYNQLKQEHECEMMKADEFRQEYDEQCSNIDKISAQLFDKNDLVEQLTNENHEIHSELELSLQKVGQLKEQTDSLNRCLSEKTSELISIQKNFEMIEKTGSIKERESIDLSNRAEYLTGQIDQRNSMLDKYQKDLAVCCQTIDEMKLERSQICDELNNLNRLISEKDQMICDKNELLAQYCKELELNYELIQELQLDRNPKSVISVKEFCEIKAQNEKLSEELEYLQQRFDSNGKPSSKIQNVNTNPANYLSRLTSPTSDYGNFNGQERWTENGKSPGSPLTFTSSKSVAWQKTNTDQSENVGSKVYELQKAIDEYNTLVTSIELSESGLNLNPTFDNQSTKRFSKTYTGSQGKQPSIVETMSPMNPKIDIDLQNPDEVDVYVVDVESTFTQARTLDQNCPIDVQNVANEELLQQVSQIDGYVSVNQPEFKDVIDLLKNCNVQIDYDENNESFETYFYRMMQKYNELEQFYLASMKISLDDPQDPSNYKSMEIFTELYGKSQQKLIQHCQLLKSSIALSTSEPTVDIQSTNEQRLSTEDMIKLVDLISTQQLQLGALHLTHKNLQNLTPIRDSKSRRISPTYLNQEYQGIWLSEDLCNPDIRMSALKVRQMSLNSRKVSLFKSTDNILAVNSIKSPVESLKMQTSITAGSFRASVKSEITKPRSGSTINMITAQESVQSKRSMKGIGSANQIIEPDNKRLSVTPKTSKMGSSLIKNDTKSINFGRQSDLYNLTESVKSQIPQEMETRINPSMVKSTEGGKTTGPNFQQHFYEGVSTSEGKAQAIKNLEDNIGYASVGQFEKEMHLLNNIDFENFDSSIDIKDRVRIYSAEIDYLNEKNLFNTYAINAVTNSRQYPQNANFVNQLCDSLTSKAQFIDKLQTEFKFDPHISKKEKELINKILDPKNDLTYRKLFDNWIKEIQTTEKKESSVDLMNKINDLTKKLNNCQSQLNSSDKSNKDKLIETLISEKACLAEELVECKQNFRKSNESSTAQDLKMTIDRLSKENENMKNLIKTQSARVNSTDQQHSGEQIGKHSKIPLLRGSTIEGQLTSDRKSVKWEDVNKRILSDMTNISRNIVHTAENLGPFKNSNRNTDDLVKASKDMMKATGKLTQAIADVKQHGSSGIGRSDDKSLLQSAGKLVSPEDVKSAIAAETSIESLRQFALLLAEDNFDLAAEIEKLLVTIEELRRQLKENCDILSETVDMLQNSENFVNQLEKKLNIETKKTQVITTRIDKLNELNGKVIFELERILKQPPSISAADMSSQERYDYLFECLKKIESENISLLTKKEELEKLLLQNSC